MRKVNCIHCDRIKCLHPKRTRVFYVFRRTCLILNDEQCPYQEKYKRPTSPPPPIRRK